MGWGRAWIRSKASPYECHPPSHPPASLHAPNPSATYQRLRETIAERMRMSPIDQALMLMELLGRSSPAPARHVARRILSPSPPQALSFVGKAVNGGAEAAPINQSNELIAVSAFISRDGVKLLNEGRKFNDYYVPDNFKINAKIAMNQLITHGNDLSPRDLWIGQSKRIWHTSCCFSDQLDVAQNGVLHQLAGFKLISG